MLENNNLVAGGKDFPWIVNILDLMIFAELIEYEEDFIGYLTSRLALNNWKGFISTEVKPSNVYHIAANIFYSAL